MNRKEIQSFIDKHKVYTHGGDALPIDKVMELVKKLEMKYNVAVQQLVDRIHSSASEKIPNSAIKMSCFNIDAKEYVTFCWLLPQDL